MGRTYSQKTIKKLYAYSLNRCYNPNCSERVCFIEDTILGEIAHIRSYSKGGARYDETLSDKEKDSDKNLLVLCPNCHKMIDDNPEKYTVELLCNWKSKREYEAINSNIIKNPTLIEMAIREISEIDLDITNYNSDTNIFDIESKISYNNIIRNKRLINEYKVYHGKIEHVYNELEGFNSFKKIRLLAIIRQIYMDEISKKYNGTDDINIIRNNSDDIFDSVRENIENRLGNASEYHINIVIPIIIVDAFIRCKILEEPH